MSLPMSPEATPARTGLDMTGYQVLAVSTCERFLVFSALDADDYRVFDQLVGAELANDGPDADFPRFMLDGDDLVDLDLDERLVLRFVGMA